MRRAILNLLALAFALSLAAPVAAQSGQQIFEQGVSILGGCVNSGCHAQDPTKDTPRMGESIPRVLKIVQPGIPADSTYRVSLLRQWASVIPGMREVIATFDPANGTGDLQLAAVIGYLSTFVSAPPPATLTMPMPIDFGDQAVGTTSGPSAAFVVNASTSAIAVAAVTVDGADFPVASDGCSGRTLASGASCAVTLAFQPSGSGSRAANVIVTSGDGTRQSFVVFGNGTVSGGANYTGLYWNAPADSEPGWGINVAHQGDVVFVTWFTYDTSGRDWWLIMVGTRTAPGVFSGQLREASGPPFDTVPFNPTGADPAQSVVGNATLDFAAAGGAKFTYTVNGTTRTKTIEAQRFAATLPVCTFGSGNPAAATNYTDLWWAAPARSENGWGINLTHQGDTIFATWFTYAPDRRPMWLFAVAGRTAPGAYTGKVYRSTGTPYNASAYGGFSYPPDGVGTIAFAFADGANGTMSYTISGVASAPVTQSKPITRQTIVAPGVVCR